MTKYIDLRSDTVTLPTKDMFSAMMEAQLGDDVKKEDISTNKLEEYAAELLGKEEGLLVPSGTMGNLIAIMCHTPKRRSEIIAESSSHIILNEADGYSHIANVGARTVHGKNGEMDPKEIEYLIRDNENIHHPITSLICVENTHNTSGGTAIGLDNLKGIYDIANKYKISTHLDGARIFNAAHALEVQAKDIAKYFDSVSICLSKGLSAPVGAVLVGSKDFINTATAMRKILGGGMRQSGVIAATGYVAITTMVDRLIEDHETAKIIGRGICDLNGVSLDMGTVQTNMVRFEINKLKISGKEFIQRLKENGVLAITQGKYSIRLVTHRHITKEDAYKTVEVIKKTVGKI